MNCMNVRPRPLRVLLPLVALSASLLLVGGCGKQEKKEAARAPVEVTALTVTPRDVPITSVFVAQTQSSQAVTIAARVSGFLDKRVYTEGAVVKAGQVLFRMDPKPFQTQVDGAAAALQRNQAAPEQALFPAELTLAAVRASVYTSAANIYKAMGGCWVTEADRMTGNALPAATAFPGRPPLF